MSTIDNNDSKNRDFDNHISNDRNLGKDLYDIEDTKESDTDASEIAERGYTVRNGSNPDGPNPDEEIFTRDSDLDDLDDDFHTDRDLEDNSDAIYEVELEDENDEFDNPSDLREEEYDFNETEAALEDIDDEDDDFIEEDIDEEDDNEYIEDDVQEDNDDEEYPENDPRKF